MDEPRIQKEPRQIRQNTTPQQEMTPHKDVAAGLRSIIEVLSHWFSNPKPVVLAAFSLSCSLALNPLPIGSPALHVTKRFNTQAL